MLNKAFTIAFLFLLVGMLLAQTVPPVTTDSTDISINKELVDLHPLEFYDPMADMVRIEGGKVPPIPNLSGLESSSSAELVYNSFFIDKFEVSNRQFAKFLTEIDSAAKYYDPRMDIIEASPRQFLAKRDKEQFPVVYVDWFGAYAFARWAGKSLPTVEEWTIAGLGTRVLPDSGSIYPWGTDIPDSSRANGLKPTVFPKLQEVGLCPRGASPYGVMDLAGNAAEWTSTEQTINVGDSLSLRLMVVNGGSFLDPAENLNLFSQILRRPDERLGSIGFRCIRRER